MLRLVVNVLFVLILPYNFLLSLFVQALQHELKPRLGQFADYSGGQAREGPVQFEKDTADPFNVDSFLNNLGESSGAGSGGKRGYGLQEEEEEREKKRARVDGDDD